MERANVLKFLVVFLVVILIAIFLNFTFGVVLVVVGVCAYLLYKKKAGQDTNDESQRKNENSNADTAEHDKEPAYVSHLEDLRDLNLRARENALAGSALDNLERVIDLLRELVPLLNQEHSGTEIAWVTNKIATDHLPALTYKYLCMGEEDRASALQDYKAGLENLLSELREVEDLTKEQKQGDFTAKAKFLKVRFGL